MKDQIQRIQEVDRQEELLMISGKCQSVVRKNDNGLQCEKCNAWLHIEGENVSLKFYKALRKASGEISFCIA